MGHFNTQKFKKECASRTANSAGSVFKFIKSYHKENGYAPSHKEIQDGCNITYSYVTKLLKTLADNGFVEYGGGSRMIKVIK